MFFHAISAETVHAKSHWPIIFDVFAPSYFLITNMPVVTEEFFLLCILAVTTGLGVCLGLDLKLLVLVLVLVFWSCFHEIPYR